MKDQFISWASGEKTSIKDKPFDSYTFKQSIYDEVHSDDKASFHADYVWYYTPSGEFGAAHLIYTIDGGNHDLWETGSKVQVVTQQTYAKAPHSEDAHKRLLQAGYADAMLPLDTAPDTYVFGKIDSW
jgi:hypothetical protein